jgi:DNA-binding GntR family transcriptional regulator
MSEIIDAQLLQDYAVAARGLIENPVVEHCMSNLSDRYLTEFVSSNADEQAVREESYLKLKALQEMQGELVSLVIAAEQEQQLMDEPN